MFDFQQMEKEMELEILQAQKNELVKKLMLAWDGLKWEAKSIFKVSVAIAYDRWLKDGYKPEIKTTRI